jgi:hypothetical protein
MTPITQEDIQAAADAYLKAGSIRTAMPALGLSYGATQMRVKRAAEQGLLGTAPVMPGFAIKSVASKQGDAWIKQTREHGAQFEVPAGHATKGVSALVDADGRIIQQWVKTGKDRDPAEAIRAVVEGFRDQIPHVNIMPAPRGTQADLCNLFILTDVHVGMLAHREEAGADYDTKIAERLVVDWMSAAVDCSPKADTAVLAVLGDFLHYSSLEAVTPASGHVLDADSRYFKVVRAAIRILRHAINLLLQSHQRVEVFISTGNHDEGVSVVLREFTAAMYETEPRIRVDTSPSLYQAFEWGATGLYLHHGHKRGVKDLDRVFAGTYREMFGRCRFNYGHCGHLHSDELVSTPLMKIERHETLAARDAYAASGGYLSGRSAKVITYSKRHGEVARLTMSPEMVAGASKMVAANDNTPQRKVA